jgi:predicted AlkP superfamily phosphohydrolase/phosphomutase/tetratricopeptide (TPR) repeat protein
VIPKLGRLERRRFQFAASILGLGAVAWLLSGMHRLDPGTSFGVVSGRLLPHGVRVVETSRFILAPRGLFHVDVFPRGAVEVALPDAAHAMIPANDGSRYGLLGSAVVSAVPARGAELAASAAGEGLANVLLQATRAAASVWADADRDQRLVSTRRLAFERKLGEELSVRGATLESVTLQGFEDLRAERPVAPVPRDTKVLVVGLDGADWRIVDPLMAAGRMPNLARLVHDGVRSNLLSITPMLSPVIWTSIATGVEPSRHGIMDFLAPTAAGVSEPVTSNARRVPALWELLSDAGVSVGVVAWWATWPASPVNGYMVTDRVAYQLFGYSSDPRSASGKTWPQSAYDVVKPLIVPTEGIPWSEVEPYLNGPRKRPEDFNDDERERLQEFRTLLAAGTTYLDAALEMRKRNDVQFEAVYFEGTDTIGHLFMSYRPPRLTSVDERSFESFHDMVDRYYENADRMLGRLLAGRDGWTVIVLSDHGFASDATRPLTTDSRIGHGTAADWHRRFGVLVMSGPGLKRGVRLEEASVYDVAPTILAMFHQPIPRSWPGRVLGDAFTTEHLASLPVRFLASDPERRGAGETPSDGERESRELRGKLQSLGYLPATDEQPMTTKNNRGVELLGAGKFSEAASVFREALEDQPDHPTLMINLGIALRFAGDKHEAQTLFEKAFRLRGGRRAAGHQLAQLRLEDGDLAGAERMLRSILETESGAAEIRNSLGLVLEKEGRIDEAKREYAESARLDSNSAEPRNNLGNLARKARHDDEAERWYLAAIEADPYFVGAYNNLALLCQDHGQVDRAIDLYGRALAKTKNNAVVMSNLASLYFTMGETREARALWKQAVAADPKYASPLNNLAGLALSEDDNEAAAAYLDRALALDPNYGDARINRSLLLRRRGDAAGARRELVEATKDPRAVGTARMQLAILDLEAGLPGEAAGELELARQHLGDRTDVLNTLGEAYARANDRARARAVLRKSLAIDPDQSQVAAAIKKLDNQ